LVLQRIFKDFQLQPTNQMPWWQPWMKDKVNRHNFLRTIQNKILQINQLVNFITCGCESSA
jgi:hypothetical protein